MLSAAPSPAAGGALLLGAAALTALGLLSDAPGRVLTWPAATVLLLLGLRDLLLRPVLAADTTGLVVRSGLRRRTVPWPLVSGLRLVTDRRTPLLEIDLDDELVVLSRQRLGRPPAQVLDELVALRG